MIKYLSIFFVFASLCFTTASTEVSFTVQGNCEMCKERIEKASKKVKGVKLANWSMKTHQIKVVFDSQITTTDKIHQAIADAGYDTDKVKSSDAKYKALPACCQYDRK